MIAPKQAKEQISEIVHNRNEVRYLIAGSASEAIEYVSFLILYQLTHLLYVSNSASFIFGVLSGFAIHKLWTFKGDQKHAASRQFGGYITLAAINFVMINILIGLFANYLHFIPAVAKLFALGTTAIWSYVISNYVIFRKTDS